jgi:hypothetical protein
LPKQKLSKQKLTKQKEDAIMKNVMELFKGDAVKFFGIDKEIVSAARTEMLEINVQKNINDWFLLAADDTYLHLEFQTTYNKDDLSRFMVSDAMLYYKEKKPVKTIVIYSSDIEETVASLDAGSIQYNVAAFYFASLNGDEAYENLKRKVEAGEPLTKHDLISIVFLPLMKNNVDKYTRLEQAIKLSIALPMDQEQEQLQIQGMLGLLVDKFITDEDNLKKLRELISVSRFIQMLIEDAEAIANENVKERVTRNARNELTLEIVQHALKNGHSIDAIKNFTGLDDLAFENLQLEVN